MVRMGQRFESVRGLRKGPACGAYGFARAAAGRTLGEVQVCPNCGEENPPKFRLCGYCGTALAAELPQQEVRKTVSIVPAAQQ